MKRKGLIWGLMGFIIYEILGIIFTGTIKYNDSILTTVLYYILSLIIWVFTGFIFYFLLPKLKKTINNNE